MNVELLTKQLARHLSGISERKALKIMREEHNVLGSYKIIGSYHRNQQKKELGDEQDVSSHGI
jgi:hypothetical protein